MLWCPTGRAQPHNNCVSTRHLQGRSSPPARLGRLPPLLFASRAAAGHSWRREVEAPELPASSWHSAGGLAADEELAFPALDGVSFTPAGLLFPYYVGAVAAMTETGLLGESTRLGGSSAGAIIAVLACSGLSPEGSMKIHNELLADITVNGTVGRLGSVLRRTLMRYLPEDIAQRATGRVTIGMTDFNGFKELPFRQVLVQSFTSKEDVIDAVCASCHIPFYLGPSVGVQFRGQELSDGALMAFLPAPWQPHEKDIAADGRGNRQRCVGVSAVPATSLGVNGYGKGIDISPDLQETPQYSFWELSRMGLLPYPSSKGEDLFQNGYNDTLVWAQSDERISSSQLVQKVHEVLPVV